MATSLNDVYPLKKTNMAMEHPPFQDRFLNENGDLPMVTLECFGFSSQLWVKALSSSYSSLPPAAFQFPDPAPTTACPLLLMQSLDAPDTSSTSWPCKPQSPKCKRSRPDLRGSKAPLHLVMSPVRRTMPALLDAINPAPL